MMSYPFSCWSLINADAQILAHHWNCFSDYHLGPFRMGRQLDNQDSNCSWYHLFGALCVFRWYQKPPNQVGPNVE